MSKHTNFRISALDTLASMQGHKIALIGTAWNRHILEKLETGALNTLLEHGVSKEDIIQIIVPGAFELPFAAKKLKTVHTDLHAIICLGCVIKGETPHDVYICTAVSNAIMQLNLDEVPPHIPVIFGVLTTNNETQALERSGGTAGHKGIEAALTALHMINLNKLL